MSMAKDGNLATDDSTQKLKGENKMKITQNFINKLNQAKNNGYENVYSVVGAYRATTYCVFHSIDSLLNLDIGFDFGNQRPNNFEGMWTGHPNTRMVNHEKDIMYSDLFRIFDEK